MIEDIPVYFGKASTAQSAAFIISQVVTPSFENFDT